MTTAIILPHLSISHHGNIIVTMPSRTRAVVKSIESNERSVQLFHRFVQEIYTADRSLYLPVGI